MVNLPTLLIAEEKILHRFFFFFYYDTVEKFKNHSSFSYYHHDPMERTFQNKITLSWKIMGKKRGKRHARHLKHTNLQFQVSLDYHSILLTIQIILRTCTAVHGNCLNNEIIFQF